MRAARGGFGERERLPVGRRQDGVERAGHGIVRPVLWGARGASVHTRILPFSCPPLLPGHGDRGPVGAAVWLGMTCSGSVLGWRAACPADKPCRGQGVAILPNQSVSTAPHPSASPSCGRGPYDAGTANDSEGNVRKLNPEDFRTHFDGLDFERGFFPLPGQLMKALMLGR